MTTPSPASARPPRDRRWRSALAFAVAASVLASCGDESPTSPDLSALPTGSGAAASSGTPAPTPSPSPTPAPTPRYTNPADEELAALIPREVAGVTVAVPPPADFALTPGDVGEAFGELGLRFTAVQVAYVSSPRLSLYAMRVEPPRVATEELEPHLGTAGQYVGIAGLAREPWELLTIDGRVAWVRPEDNATAAGTMIYTWADGEHVFLMIGVDDALNRALFAALPGEPAPTPTPRPSRSPRASAASGEPGATVAPSATEEDG